MDVMESGSNYKMPGHFGPPEIGCVFKKTELCIIKGWINILQSGGAPESKIPRSTLSDSKKIVTKF